MGFLIVFGLVLVLVLVIAGYSSRKKSIQEGTWLGMSGAKASYLWNHSSPKERRAILASVSILDGPYRDGLLSKEWKDVPDLVRISLSKTLEQIRQEQK